METALLHFGRRQGRLQHGKQFEGTPSGEGSHPSLASPALFGFTTPATCTHAKPLIYA